jgi:hypothetical protein
MQLASIADLRLVERAREAARRVFKIDRQLDDPAHRLLAERVDRILQEGGNIS